MRRRSVGALTGNTIAVNEAVIPTIYSGQFEKHQCEPVQGAPVNSEPDLNVPLYLQGDLETAKQDSVDESEKLTPGSQAK